MVNYAQPAFTPTYTGGYVPSTPVYANQYYTPAINIVPSGTPIITSPTIGVPTNIVMPAGAPFPAGTYPTSTIILR